MAWQSGSRSSAHDGPFLDNRGETGAPPFIRLRELEAANRAIESDADDEDPAIDDWLRMLLAPGASLGGARPKATVLDPHGHLWIAKFPSVRDRYDVGAWRDIATSIGIGRAEQQDMADAFV